jgi:cation:H+ antiporter
MLINFIALATGLIVLVFSADKFVSGTASIARNLGVPPLLIGLTIVGLGTSAPEILISAIASSQGNSGLAVGNALGSNIANIALILGCTALIAPLTFASSLLKRELPFLVLISVFLSSG